MDFKSNETLVEMIKEGSYGGTYFRDILETYFLKEFDVFKNIDQKYYCSDY